MKANAIAIAASLAFGSMLYMPTAQAGDVTNASLACYVETTAYDQLTSGYCAAGWTPGEPHPTIAHFEVLGLPAGNYTFTWSSSQCSAAANWCNRPIRRDTSLGRPVTLTVTIRDTATGASKTVSATAEYFDVWN
jgi:hypothetical protein